MGLSETLMFQGFLIFLVTVCKKQVYQGLKKKMNALTSLNSETRMTEMTPVDHSK